MKTNFVNVQRTILTKMAIDLTKYIGVNIIKYSDVECIRLWADCNRMNVDECVSYDVFTNDSKNYKTTTIIKADDDQLHSYVDGKISNDDYLDLRKRVLEHYFGLKPALSNINIDLSKYTEIHIYNDTTTETVRLYTPAHVSYELFVDVLNNSYMQGGINKHEDGQVEFDENIILSKDEYLGLRKRILEHFYS
jgi:hypothetical protein